MKVFWNNLQLTEGTLSSVNKGLDGQVTLVFKTKKNKAASISLSVIEAVDLLSRLKKVVES